MKYIHLRSKLFVISGLFMVALAVPVRATAEVLPLAAAPPSSIVITEIQTGATAASDEFIELYNLSDKAVDIGDWQVRYQNVASASEETDRVATITAGTTLPGRSHYVLHTASVPLGEGIMGQEYAPTLSNTAKVVALFAINTAACQLSVQDAIAWGDSTKGEGVALPAGDEAMHKHIFRYSAADQYVDTNSNAYDAGIADVSVVDGPVLNGGALPGVANGQMIPEGTPPSQGSASGLQPITIKDCGSDVPGPSAPQPPCAVPPPATPVSPVTATDSDDGRNPPDPYLPEGNIGLVAPQISELLPDPAKPQTDAADEFIELYNPNAAAFELSGFILEVEGETKKRHAFPKGTMLEPKAFAAFMSKDTKLALANASGQVRLLDPFGRTLGQSEAYEAAQEGQAWLSANNTWQWTATPTPGALNIIKAPAGKKRPGPESKTPDDGGIAIGTAKNTSAPSVEGVSDTTQADAHAASDGQGFSPLHPAILALTGVIAVLYGIYEYRSDLANKLHEFRANRAARRSLRQAAKRG